MSRTIAIGDIHGCSKALIALLGKIRPTATDHLIFLGDYIDRGPDSKGVIDVLISLRSRCRTTFLRGNHEVMLISLLDKNSSKSAWLESGGATTLTCYGGTLKRFPKEHRDFLNQTKPYYETEAEIYVHANYESQLTMERQSDKSLYWDHLSERFPDPHVSGKRVFCGHSPQLNGRIGNFGYLICVDTYCFGGRYLTGIDVKTMEAWQFDRRGFAKEKSVVNRIASHMRRVWKSYRCDEVTK